MPKLAPLAPIRDLAAKVNEIESLRAQAREYGETFAQEQSEITALSDGNPDDPKVVSRLGGLMARAILLPRSKKKAEENLEATLETLPEVFDAAKRHIEELASLEARGVASIAQNVLEPFAPPYKSNVTGGFVHPAHEIAQTPPKVRSIYEIAKVSASLPSGYDPREIDSYAQQCLSAAQEVLNRSDLFQTRDGSFLPKDWAETYGT